MVDFSLCGLSFFVCFGCFGGLGFGGWMGLLLVYLVFFGFWCGGIGYGLVCFCLLGFFWFLRGLILGVRGGLCEFALSGLSLSLVMCVLSVALEYILGGFGLVSR